MAAPGIRGRNALRPLGTHAGQGLQRKASLRHQNLYRAGEEHQLRDPALLQARNPPREDSDAPQDRIGGKRGTALSPAPTHGTNRRS